MKKLTLIIATIALLIGFSQCKKEDIPTSENEGVRITLTAGYGQNGQRTGFNPSGSFVWSSTTEYINVGGKRSGYLGQLTGTGDGTDKISFSGTINTPAADEETLYFFYLGNGDHKEATTMDFSNQYGDLDRITNWHVAIGSASYIGEGSYNVTLDMAMAIAYVDVSGFVNASNTLETVYIHGNDVYSTATVDYNNGTITGASKGYIRLGNEIGNPQKYVALIPSTSSETTLSFDSESKTGSMTFLRGIQAGKYYSNGDNALSMTVDAGAGIPGTFSVSATKKVFFSKGNLQYQASTGTWRFAENQYDNIGSDNANISSTYDGWIDLFGWGTGNNPTQTSTTASDYSTFTDWGINTISNSDGYSHWRSLTKDEWVYLFNTGTNRCMNGIYYVKCRIFDGSNYINGIIVLPDNWDPENYSFSSDWYNKNAIAFDKVTVSLSDWTNKIENHGGVFLPICGLRNGNTVNNLNNAYYWSSTPYNNYSYAVYLTNYSGNFQNNYSIYKYNGCAVRLVRE